MGVFAMPHDWFVVRKGKEVGPVTAQRLKEMVADGELTPDDLVRRGDMKSPTKAGSIKGLFPKETEQHDPASNKTRNRVPLMLGVSVATVLLVACCGGLGFMAFLGNKLEKTTRAEAVEADAAWEKGDKAGAAAKYRRIAEDHRVRFLNDGDRPRVYGRAIDFEYDRGDAAAGKALLDRAEKDGVVPAVSHADAVAAVTAIQAEKARVEAAKAEKQRVAEANKKEEERQAKMTPQEKLRQAKLDGNFVPAAALYDEFRGNEVAASELYARKTIRIVGEVDRVVKGGALTSDRILLRREGSGVAVSCSLAGGNIDELKQLQPGSWVRVEGRCDGKNLIGGVEMSGCIFVLVER
jgi:hypothetical protein